MRFSDLENIRVAILGMGREGQAVWRQIRKRYPDKPLSLFTESAINEGFAQQTNSAIDDYHFGPLEVASLKQFDVLVRSAGISPYRHELQQLRSLGLQFTSASNLWFAENPDAKTICISGTMGKSTTAALTAHLLTEAGAKTCLAGNIGRPMLDCENGDTQWWVIELSSYQISDLEAAPDIALLLNLSDEHLDWHGGAERYRADKLKLADLAARGRLIANFSDPRLVEQLKQYPGVIWFNHKEAWQAREGGVSGGKDRYVSAPASLPGEHNMQNLAAALTVLDELGLEIPRLGEALASFTGLPHRLQLIGEKAGIRYVDDSISTNPVSVTAALQTIGNRDVVLLLGGMDRGLDWNNFSTDLAGRAPYAIITIPDNGPKIFGSLKKAGIEPEGGLHQSLQLAEAVALAQTLVPEKGCILLSPGAPSFPHFRDYEDRGNQFKKFAGIEKNT
jgi:UDP-N-acetylmuramoylalanine--D-glutamate ligase